MALDRSLHRSECGRLGTIGLNYDAVQLGGCPDSKLGLSALPDLRRVEAAVCDEGVKGRHRSAGPFPDPGLSGDVGGNVVFWLSSRLLFK